MPFYLEFKAHRLSKITILHVDMNRLYIQKANQRKPEMREKVLRVSQIWKSAGLSTQFVQIN
ncbi:MAG: hypothetical protein CVU39_18730 [Chloroflexi bacterium HGW-Chloroflexi-10]|nr:MAG: hypothetical protein CVU39_18730 [Chloroflexi bacterium HGW-Chloroflexi-10]